MFLNFQTSNTFVYCPLCDKAWYGSDPYLYKDHPNHVGESIEYPGVFIQVNK